MQIHTFKTIRGANRLEAKMRARFPARKFATQVHEDFRYCVVVVDASGRPIAKVSKPSRAQR